jgi:hypothetical protein
VFLVSVFIFTIIIHKFEPDEEPVSLFGVIRKTKPFFTLSFVQFIVGELFFAFLVISEMKLWHDYFLLLLLGITIFSAAIVSVVPADKKHFYSHYIPAICTFTSSFLAQTYLDIRLLIVDPTLGYLSLAVSTICLTIILGFLKNKYKDRVLGKKMHGLKGSEEMLYVFGMLIWICIFTTIL